MREYPLGWIGVDLDGTLAITVPDRFQIDVIGQPIPSMVRRVCEWIDAGRDVRIMTARVGPTRVENGEAEVAERAIRAWCLRHIGCELPVTCTKDYEMAELWDDRAVSVERDTGVVLTLGRG